MVNVAIATAALLKTALKIKTVNSVGLVFSISQYPLLNEG